MQKTILVTGFSPFPGMPVNPTALLIEQLRKTLPHHRQRVRFHYARLPTTWAGRHETTDVLRKSLKPNAIVHFGVDGSRPQINVETRAVNTATRTTPDADGVNAEQARLLDGGETERYATLPVLPLLKALQSTGLQADLSRDAGTYLCNATLYDSIGSGIPAVFIHVPKLAHGRKERGVRLMTLEKAARALLLDVARRL